MIRLAREIRLPLDAVTQGLAFLGRRGAGKTYAAGVLVEGLLEAHAQVVVFDPVGNWYGLRVASDGKAKGFEIPVFDGEHGDVPLEPGAGALLADLIVENGISAASTSAASGRAPGLRRDRYELLHVWREPSRYRRQSLALPRRAHASASPVSHVWIAFSQS